MNMKNAKTFAAAAATASMLILPCSASANLVVDGGFESGAVPDGSYETYHSVNTMGGWTVAAGSVDLIRTYWQPAEGAQSVDMAGFFENGTIKQTITGLIIAQYYLLTFAMAGNPDDNGNGNTMKTLQATFGSPAIFTFDTTGKDHSNMGWVTKTAVFVATATSMDLIFNDLSTPAGTAWGAALDNVSLVAVPEPTTMIAGGLLLLPFAASTLRVLRKKRMA
jgi:choice-of-anchor C domain-containing protein